MTGHPDKEAAGYKRPPKATRWKKGQTGNPKKIRGNNRKKHWQVIEQVLARQITITENGQKRKIAVLEGILLQLHAKAISGSRPAVRVLRKYRAFAKSMPDLYMESAKATKDRAEQYRKYLDVPDA